MSPNPGITTVFVRCADGTALAATVHAPTEEGDGRKVAIVVSSMGDRRERYHGFAAFLAEQGWRVVTFDYRGIGGSRALASSSGPSLRDWGQKDVAEVIDWVSAEFRPTRLVAVTHSVGGQVLGLAPNGTRLDAALAIGVQKGYWRHYPWPRRHAILSATALAPAVLALSGRLPGWFFDTDDLPPEVIRDWRRWALRPGYLDAKDQPLDERFRAFRAPILALSFEDDQAWAPRRAVDALLAIYASAPSAHYRLCPHDLGVARIGHSGFFDARVCPRPLWIWSSRWLGRASAAAPSFEEPPVGPLARTVCSSRRRSAPG